MSLKSTVTAAVAGPLAAAKAMTVPALQRLHRTRIDPPPIPLSWGLLFLVVAVAVIPVARCDAARDRDQWWREQIAEKSASVREVMDRHQADIDDTDSLILKALEDTDDRLTAAEAELQAARNRQSRDGCPRVPSVCLREGAGGR